MPLNDRAGLIQWVARADTLQNVCRQERKVTGVAIDLELKAQVSHAPDLNKGTLSAMQQLECLELALDLTDGKELANVLWKKSESHVCELTCTHRLIRFVCCLMVGAADRIRSKSGH